MLIYKLLREEGRKLGGSWIEIKGVKGLRAVEYFIILSNKQSKTHTETVDHYIIIHLNTNYLRE